ncbi:ISL3-like element ISAar19 family transposase [Glutamicibacter arilaitensis]|uniref:ISL3-like element ISAar19 family transposase n=7 Tax=Glutamicibacter TaxID=1742989 RepID=A0A2N7S4V4_9MICC|nr:ISL3-like element ISAar19 family transposase [Glutamicibacter arilaitensis]PMQ18797.1 ISL3-like element ISAar19 family transposase [Glutamicibacter arilaitensis]PMQ18917.1 ISL3-like element ISAar19 family transposase [Glutamicibacter arilaitensis]PMQ19508.1 ISL3-like element ISAar19 family transposase [Glutamicibacter arilaitensis]PMQ19638.1 ISL3-like element ISAar19 family transposase [Glutamicibacter arilaitensis]PMQ19941.1 ISL3-like element ISAar19 family transposase [Glutamicibacter ari
MLNPTFTAPDLTTFTNLDGLGLTAIGQHLSAAKAEILCHVTNPIPWCQTCGAAGIPRDTVTRRLAHEPLGWRPTVLVIKHRRYRCANCQRVWREELSQAVAPRQKISRTGLRWALVGLVCHHLSVSRIAEGLGVTWNTANEAVLAEGQRLLIDDPTRFDGVKVLGVDEHVWRHTRTGDKYVTVIVDLTAVRDGTGTARLIDMVPGRSKAVFKTWLADQEEQWKQGIEVVAMDGFTGFKTAAVEELPHAVEVLDPFHVVKLGSEALDQTRQRIQREQHGRRGRKDDPLYKCRRTLTTGLSLATEKQKTKLEDLFKEPEYEPVQLVWSVYQKMVDAYRQPKPEVGRWALEQLINEVGTKVPKGLPELKKLGGTLRRRKTDILAYFDHIGSSNGPTEALNGRLEHLRGIALGFKNLAHYIARSLLETGGFRRRLHPQS